MPDDALLTTREVAKWLGVSAKSVLRMPIKPAAMRSRERRFLAREVKAYILGRPAPSRMPLRRMA